MRWRWSSIFMRQRNSELIIISSVCRFCFPTPRLPSPQVGWCHHYKRSYPIYSAQTQYVMTLGNWNGCHKIILATCLIFDQQLSLFSGLRDSNPGVRVSAVTGVGRLDSASRSCKNSFKILPESWHVVHGSFHCMICSLRPFQIYL